MGPVRPKYKTLESTAILMTLEKMRNGLTKACRSGLGGTICLWVVEGVEAPRKLSRRELCGDVDLDWL